jgi:hypothetical protein
VIKYPLRKKKIVTPSGDTLYGKPEWPMKTIITAMARIPVSEAISEGSFAGLSRGVRLINDGTLGTVIANLGIVTSTMQTEPWYLPRSTAARR